MEYGAFRHGSESQDSDEPAPPGSQTSLDSPSTSSPVLPVSSKGVENAKKRLRAFSIQKKAPLTVPAVKPVSTGNTTVLIGKLSSVKVTPKPDKVEDDQKKPPKPPKPGGSRKYINESYTDLQRKTLSEIEDMKRKMELVELGIPLGLICPSTNALPVKAMPTKAMPPIKTFLDSAKVDAIIREAKKAKAEGKEFKFDYQKFVPDYDNPFQRKKDLPESEKKDADKKEEEPHHKYGKDKEKDYRKSDRYDKRYDYKKDDRDRHRDFRDRDKTKDKDRKEIRSNKEDRSKEREDKSRDMEDKNKEKEEKSKERVKEDDKNRKVEELVNKEVKKPDRPEKPVKETDVDLNDYLVCDSWSLDNDDRPVPSPQVDKSKKGDKENKTFVDPLEQLRQSLGKTVKETESPKPKVEKLKPVIDSFKFEIDPNEDEILDIFDDDSDLEKYAKPKKSKKKTQYDYEPDNDTNDCLNDDTFLESVINEIKQENMSDDDSHDKGLVEYDESPDKDTADISIGSITPELDDKIRLQSQRSDYSDGYRSTDSRKSTESYKSTASGYKSVESGYKSTESFKSVDSEYKSGERGFKSSESGYKKSNKASKDLRISVDRDVQVVQETKISRDTQDSLETWSFVLKICQPLLFRHDKNKCYKETRQSPKVWYTENPKLCNCVKDRSVVYEELEMCKMNLVDRLYGCDPVSENPNVAARTWYPVIEQCLVEHPKNSTDHLASEWDIDEAQVVTPERQEVSLDREYQRFMEAVSWPEVEEKQDSRSTTPVRPEKKKKAEDRDDKKKAKKIKLSSEGWSQESDVEEEKSKPQKEKKEKIRKRKHSPDTISSSDSEDTSKKRKKALKKKDKGKTKMKAAKRRRLEKKMRKKLKDKKKKKKEMVEESEIEEEEPKKKSKKKKQQKLKKKTDKKKKIAKSSSSDTSSSSDSSSESDSESDRKSKKKKKKEAEARKKKKDKKKKRKQSTSDSAQSEELFDVNILNNIKTERVTDDERMRVTSSSPPPPTRHREIIDVKQLHDDFSSTVQIKQEAEEETKTIQTEDIQIPAQKETEIEREEKREPVRESEIVSEAELMNRFDLGDGHKPFVGEKQEKEFKEPDRPPIQRDDTSQCSSQESITSVKEYEKDESHLRPSSQNSNYSFNDVMASQAAPYKVDDKFEYENYEMYEQLAMEYQSDVASQQISPPSSSWSRIETVVGARRGEIKCDWRPTDTPRDSSTAHRPSRWGLKPGEVNIVLTGGSEPVQSEPVQSEPVQTQPEQHVYKIQSLANRTDSGTMGYDEAYMDTYGAADRLQYGDCFASTPQTRAEPPRQSTLDDRINQALRDTVLGEVAKDEAEKESPGGILLTKSVTEGRGVKRVSFADGYKPGQDSDVEEPPVKKRKPRRVGCAWPCPALHPDHTPLWDALPPPPPPPGSPPPAAAAAPPPLHLLRPPHPHHPHHQRYDVPLLPAPPHTLHHKFDPSVTIPNFMPPEPPPGIISFP